MFLRHFPLFDKTFEAANYCEEKCLANKSICTIILAQHQFAISVFKNFVASIIQSALDGRCSTIFPFEDMPTAKELRSSTKTSFEKSCLISTISRFTADISFAKSPSVSVLTRTYCIY